MSEIQECIILQGPPGSGKTTKANEIAARKRRNTVIISANSKCVDENGNYKFNPKDLQKNHLECIQEAIEHMKQGLSVIIDNTNIYRKHCFPYVYFAHIYGIPIRFISLTTEFANIHNVPGYICDKMKNDLEELTIENVLGDYKLV
jgi:predicted kinase